MCGMKSRGNWLVDICLRYDCINQGEDKICKKCFRFSLYEPLGKDDDKRD